jgi:hypothetical protein
MFVYYSWKCHAYTLSLGMIFNRLIHNIHHPIISIKCNNVFECIMCASKTDSYEILHKLDIHSKS